MLRLSGTRRLTDRSARYKRSWKDGMRSGDVRLAGLGAGDGRPRDDRLDRGGNRQLNGALRGIAVTQPTRPADSRACLACREAEGRRGSRRRRRSRSGRSSLRGPGFAMRWLPREYAGALLLLHRSGDAARSPCSYGWRIERRLAPGQAAVCMSGQAGTELGKPAAILRCALGAVRGSTSVCGAEPVVTGSGSGTAGLSRHVWGRATRWAASIGEDRAGAGGPVGWCSELRQRGRLDL